MKTVRLRPGKERSALRRHPWIFEGSVASGKADGGETVRVEDSAGRFLAWAAYSPLSSIRLRAWSFDEGERIDAAFFERRIAAAVAMRARLRVASSGVRLVHGEADGLPGLIVDRYGEVLSAQFLSAGVERWKATIADALLKSTGARALYERSDTSAREREGLRPASGLAGAGRPREQTRLRRRPRSRSTSTAGASPSTSPAATRPASISTSATTASSSPTSSGTSPSSASSTATATPAASASPRWPVAQRTSPPSILRRRRWRAPPTTSPATASTPHDTSRSTPTSTSGCAPFSTSAAASMRSSSIRRSSRRPSPTPSAPRAPTRTSTGSR